MECSENPKWTGPISKHVVWTKALNDSVSIHMCTCISLYQVLTINKVASPSFIFFEKAVCS